MKFQKHNYNNTEFAELISDDFQISNGQDLLDLIANAPARILLIPKENFNEKFFDLKTGVAGEILQKVSTYQFKLGIIGDFSRYKSQSLKDFIYESNRVRRVVFIESIREAMELLS